MNDNGHTQTTAGEALGVSQSTVQRWLSGVMPDSKGRAILAEALGTSPDAIIDLSANDTGVGDTIAAAERLGAALVGTGDRLARTASAGELTSNQRTQLSLSIDDLRERVAEFSAQLDHVVDILGE